MKKQIIITVALIFVAAVAGIFVGRAMRGNHPGDPNADPAASSGAKIKFWTCSMHPQIRQPKPGKCPLCAMVLIPIREGQDDNLGARELKLSASAAMLADIEVTPVIRMIPEMKIRMVGKIEYDETRIAYITARFPGRLDRLFVDYTGVSVKKGDHLALIYSPELLTAQQALIQSKRIVEEMGKDAVPVIRERAMDTMRSAREKLRLWDLTPAQIEQVEKSGKTSDHLEINSPISGVVIHKNAVEGVYLKTGETIYTIADLSQIWVMLDAYESDLQWIHYGQEVEFVTEAIPGEKFSGRISFRDPVLNPKTRTVKIRLNLDNKDGRLKPDMFVRAIVKSKIATGGRVMDPLYAGKWISPMHPEIVSDKPGECTICGMALVTAESLGYATATNVTVAPLVIPASAPLITGKRAVVYVTATNRPGIYEGRQITLGPRAGNYYLVKEGLKEGELVVTSGSFKIDSAIQILAKPSMMNPTGGGPAPGHNHGGSSGEHAGHDMGPKSFTATTPAAFKTQLSATVKAYQPVHANLSTDKQPTADQVTALADAVQAADMSLLQGDAHMAWMADLKLLKQGIATLKQAPDIKSARTAFGQVSGALIKAVREFGTAPGADLFLYHCPMAFDNKGGNWLQDKEGTLNPYFGSKMLKCGEMKQQFKPAAAADHSGHGEHEKHGATPPPGGERAPANFRTQLSKAIVNSANLQSALAADKQPPAAELTAFANALAAIDMKLLTSPGHMDWMKQLKEIRTGIDRMTKANGIVASRIGFESISNGLIAALKKFGGTGSQSFYLYHCPMAFDNKGANWLQDKEGTLNPYFGAKMLKCGSLKEEIK